MRSRACRGRLAAVVVAVVCTAAGAARAEGPGDGLYGRWDRAFTMSLGLGGGVARSAGADHAVMVGELRLRHLDSAGPFVAGRWGPHADSQLVLGVEIRPLFPMLFLEDHFSGYEAWDLLVQSLGIEMGPALVPLDSHLGVGLALGAGLEVPLVLPSWWAQGVWLRLAFRYVLAPARFQSGPGRNASGWTAYATLAVKTSVAAPVTIRPPRSVP